MELTTSLSSHDVIRRKKSVDVNYLTLTDGRSGQKIR